MVDRTLVPINPKRLAVSSYDAIVTGSGVRNGWAAMTAVKKPENPGT